MVSALSPGWVLHRRPYRNTSLLLEVFCSDHGRFGMVARGAQRPKSMVKGLLQPFQPLLLAWTGKGELMTLAAAEADGSGWPGLPPRRLLSGFYLNELLMRLLPRHEPYPELFDSYRSALYELAAEHDEQAVLRRFELQLLAGIGYGLQLTSDSDGRPIDPQGGYDYIADTGTCRRNAGDTVRGVAVTGHTLLALADGRFDEPEVLAEAKRLTRYVLTGQLQDRPLKTRDLARFWPRNPAR